MEGTTKLHCEDLEFALLREVKLGGNGLERSNKVLPALGRENEKPEQVVNLFNLPVLA